VNFQLSIILHTACDTSVGGVQAPMCVVCTAGSSYAAGKAAENDQISTFNAVITQL